MRFAVLLALLGLALAARHHSSKSEFSSKLSEKYFRAGREYRYKYDGYLSAGLPVPGEQSAATRIQSLVRLQPENDRSVRLQLVNTRFATAPEGRFLAFEHMKEVHESENVKKVLSLPVRFSYRHGMVGEIEFHPDEQNWSSSIKKAVINMLQVNLLKKGSNEKIEQASQETENDFFLSNERTLEGECEVAYTQVWKSENQQQWTKSINFEKCSVRPQVAYGRRNAEECQDCHQEDEKMSSTVLTYNITGSQQEYLINSVELKSKHIFAAVTEKHQLLVSKVLSKLELVYSGEQDKEIEPVRSAEKTENLLYNPEHELAEEKYCQTGDEKYLRRLPGFQDQLEIIRQAINRLAKQVEQGIELETNHNLARLVKVLRFATEDNLNQLRRHVAEKPEGFQALYLDALALAGTKVTISHLLEKIQNNNAVKSQEVSPLKAAQLMKMIAEVRIPSEQIAQEVQRFCESDIVSRNSPLRQSCWLSYGSVVHGACGEHQNIYGAGVEEKKCTRQTKEQIIRQLIEKVNQADTRYEKVLFIKAIANAGLDVSVVELEKIIRDQNQQKTVRMQAIDALRRLRTVMPRKIQAILMPVYMDNQELPEMRMLALNMILQTKPQQTILDVIVRQQQKERSQQVRVYTYSTLKTLSQSENPAEAEIARRAGQALASLPRETLGWLESKHKEYTFSFMQSGASLHLAALFSNDSVLPKELSASIESVIGGEWNKYLGQIGLVQSNLDSVLSKILQKVEDSGLEQLVVRGKRSSSFFRPADMLRSLVETLRISHRQVSNDEPHAMLYIRYKDMDYAFLPIDVDTVPEMIRRVARDGQLDLSEIEKILNQIGRFAVTGSAFFHETHRKMPTALGMPLVMTSKMPTVAHVSGMAKFELEPKNSDKFNGLRVRLQAKPQIASTHVTKVELLSPVGSVGVKLLAGGRINSPVDAEIEINWDKKVTIKTVVKAPEQKRHVAHFMTRPAVFIREWTKEQRQYPEPREYTIQLREDKYPIHYFEREYFEETGIKVIASGHYRTPLKTLPNLIAENIFDIIIEPTEEAPKEIVAQISLSAFEQGETIEPRLLGTFYEKNSDVFETEINEEYEQPKESERQAQFQQQLRQIKGSKSVKHSIQMKIQTVGGVKRQEIETEIRGHCDENMRFCRVHFDCQRSPIQGESRQWQLQSVTEWLYPQQPSSLKKMFEQPHREWTCMCNTKWGADQQNEVVIRIQGEQSREQKRWMKRVEREQSSLSQEQKLEEAAKLNQYKIQAEFELAPETQFWMDNLYGTFKTYNFFSVDVSPKEGRQNRVECRLTIEPETRQLANLTIQTPKELTELRDVKMPFQLPVANIRRHFGSIKSVSHLARSVEKHSRPECVVKPKEVKTFDDVFYRTPMTTCYSVLAKDCSENTNFAVLMKKVRKNGQEMKLKVISNENVIELEKTESEIVVRVNGKETQEEEQMEKVGVNKRSEDRYHVETDDVSVEFDGYNAKIRMSALYKNKQCGLCGHYDGEKNNEFRRADNEETEDIEEFSRSFLTKDEQCNAEEEMSSKRSFRLLSEETSSSEEDQQEQETLEPVLRNRILERGQKVCFSEEAVQTCPPKTQEQKVERKPVTFKCIERSDKLAQQLMRLARKEVISEKLSELTKTIEKEIRIPRACLAN